MLDWNLSDVVQDWRKAVHMCPLCGLHLFHPALGDRWYEELPPWSSDVREDLKELERHEISTVQQLLAMRPSELRRITDMPSERAAGYRLLARLYRWHRFAEAWHLLVGTRSTEAQKLSPALAFQLVAQENNRNEHPIEVIIDMRDKLSFEELSLLSREERLSRRREHADRSQRQLVGQLELREGVNDGGYLQGWLANQLVVSLTPRQILNAASNEAVGLITFGLPVEACLDHAMTRISASQTRAGLSGEGQIVALLDSGVDASHPDLTSCSITQKKGYVGRGMDDEFGHGTHLAGIVASSHATYSGVAPGADLWSYRVLDHNGNSSSTQSLIDAIQDLVSDAKALNPPQPIVANCSFAVPLSALATQSDYDTFCNAFNEAANDLIVVAAAGNSGPDSASITAPGCGRRVITVGATIGRPAGLDFVSPFSSRGPARQLRKPDLVAPGGYRNPKGDAFANVSMISSRRALSTLDSLTTAEKPWKIDADHYGLSGTSQATALVSGACALLLESAAKKGLTATHAHLASALRQIARPLGFGPNEEGSGLIDVDRAVSLI